MTNGIKRRASACIAACLLFMQASLFPVQAEEAEKSKAEVDFAQDAEIPEFSLHDSHGYFSDSEMNRIAERIYKTLRDRGDYVDLGKVRDNESNIGLSDFEKNRVEGIFSYVVMNTDVGVLVERQGSIDGGAVMDGIFVHYSVDPADPTEYYECYNELHENLDHIVSGVDADWSDVEKAMYLYGIVADYLTYSERTTGALIDALEERKSLCEGYTWLYGALLRRVGIESIPVSSTIETHMWNMVKIGDAWYHADVTNGDAYSPYSGLMIYDYFLRSNNGLYDISGYNTTDWETIEKNVLPKDVGTEFDDAIWITKDATYKNLRQDEYSRRRIRSTIVPHQDGWAMIMPNAENDYYSGDLILWDLVEDEQGDISYEVREVLKESFYDIRKTGVAPYYALQNFEGDLLYTYRDSVRVYWRDPETNTYHEEIIAERTEEDKDNYLKFMGVNYWNGELNSCLGDKPDKWAVQEYFFRDLTDLIPKNPFLPEPTEPETTASETTVTETTASETTEPETTASETTVTETTATETTEPEETTTTETTTVAITETTTETTTTAAPAQRVTLGDANNDGVIADQKDLDEMTQYVLGKLSAEKIAIKAMDFTKDGVVDAFDIALMKRFMNMSSAEREAFLCGNYF